MPERRLPLDVVYAVADEFRTTAALYPLLNLCLTCRDIYLLTVPLLYKEVRLTNLRSAHHCFQTLLHNDLTAASVQTLQVYIHGQSSSEPFIRESYSAIPLFTSALRRLRNLSGLYLYPTITDSEYTKELKKIFEVEYPFSLRRLHLNFHYTCPAMMSFVQRQTELRELGITEFILKELSSVTHPALETLVIDTNPVLSWANGGAIKALVQHNRQVKHITLRVFFVRMPHALQTGMTNLLTGMTNLTSLHLFFARPEDIAIPLDLKGGPIWSSSLRLLKITILGREADSLSILSCINPVLRGYFPNLIAMWLNCAPPPAMSEPFTVSKIDGPTWDFYFESCGRMWLAKCRKGKDLWMAEQIEPRFVPLVQARLCQLQE